MARCILALFVKVLVRVCVRVTVLVFWCWCFDLFYYVNAPALV